MSRETSWTSCTRITNYCPLARCAGPRRAKIRGSRRRSFWIYCDDAGAALLLDEMRRHGARGRIVARMAGGARMFTALLSSGTNMGQRNIIATRAALERLGIRVVAEDVGGEYGRSVRVDSTTGVMRVRSLAGGDREL
jgi:chemotaxis protein CheD